MSKTVDPSTAEFFRRAKRGDDEALEQLLEGVRPYIRMLAESYVRKSPRLDASHVTQDALMQAAQAIADFRGYTNAEFQSWLQTILRSKIIDETRRIGAAKRGEKLPESLDQSRDGRRQNEVVVDQDQTSPSGKLVRKENAIRIATSLEQLDQDQRTAVQLRHFDGCSIKEMRGHFPERSDDAIRQLIRRGLTNLRSLLDDLAE